MRYIAVLYFGVLALQGCAASTPPANSAAGQPASTPTPKGTEAARGTVVAMDGVSFSPENLTVKVGETVTWTNKDPFPHNVKAADGSFESGEIAPDAKWQYRAAAAGRFPYTCTLHPGMDGILIVEP